MSLVSLTIGQMYAQIKSDYDKETDFTQYKTYTFKGWEKESDKQLNEFDKNRILGAFKKELTARGLTPDDSDPDLGITLFVVVNDKTSTSAYTSYNGNMGYGMGRFGGWGYGGMGMSTATTTYTEEDYKEGTIVIDFYDNESNKLVWQGVITDVVKEKAEKREKSIPKHINKLMKKYPVDPVK